MPFTELQANHVFASAMQHQQCAELLNTLIEGGGFTMDPITHKLIFLPEAAIKEILEASRD